MNIPLNNSDIGIPLCYSKQAQKDLFQGQLTDSISFLWSLFSISLVFVTTDISKPAWLLNAVASKTQQNRKTLGTILPQLVRNQYMVHGKLATLKILAPN